MLKFMLRLDGVMYNLKVLLFMEFLKENKEISEKLNLKNLNLETVEDKLIPLAKENGFAITAKDIFRFLKEYLEEKNVVIDDSTLSQVAGGAGIFNRIMATGLLALTGLTGFVGNQAYAMYDGEPSVSQSQSVETVKTIKDRSNNTLSDAEIKYYQEKIGSDYKFVSNEGMNGSFATAYKLEGKDGNEFVLKISNDPKNSGRWIQHQRETDEKIKKYYKDYKGDLKITNYVKIGDDFVIEEYLGEQLNPYEMGKYSKEDIEGFINGMAEFLNYTHHKELKKDSPFEYTLGTQNMSLKDAYDYLNGAGALNEQDQKMLINLISNFENRDKKDEVSVLVHTDIRAQNIVYNSKTKKFALIDFDSLLIGVPIYYSFTSGTVGSFGIPYDIASKIIDKYNEISDLKVNKEKIKMMHKLGCFFEKAVIGKFVNELNEKDIREKLRRSIKERFEAIDNGFGEL